MNRWVKIGVVLAGYVLAVVISIVAVAIYDRRFTEMDNQTMGGMIAGGEMMYGGAVFFLVSLIPTGMALWFLRNNLTFWSLFTAACIAFAAGGLVTVLGMGLTRGTPPRTSVFALIDFFAIIQMLGSPLWVGGFAVFTRLAPPGMLRRRMVVALAIELVVGLCGIAHFLTPRLV